MGNAVYRLVSTGGQTSDLFMYYKFENDLEDSSINGLNLIQDGGTVSYVSGVMDWALYSSDYVGGGA